MEYGYVWWMDTSVRVKSRQLEPVLKAAETDGIVFTTLSHDKNLLSLVKQTDQQTFQYLHEDPCKFRAFAEVSATTILLKSTNVTNALVKAWAICALNKDCIAPEGTQWKKICNFNVTTDGRCHRFDQSMFGILTTRLFHDKISNGHENILTTVIDVQRGQVTHYFQKCYLILKCLA